MLLQHCPPHCSHLIGRCSRVLAYWPCRYKRFKFWIITRKNEPQPVCQENLSCRAPSQGVPSSLSRDFTESSASHRCRVNLFAANNCCCQSGSLAVDRAASIMCTMPALKLVPAGHCTVVSALKLVPASTCTVVDNASLRRLRTLSAL